MPLDLFNDRALTCTDVVASESSFRAIQGYSLVGHGRKNVWLGLMRFQAPDERKAELRAFLKQFGSTVTNSFNLWLGRQQYLDAKKQGMPEEDLGKLKQTVLAPMVTALGLSASGYQLFPEATVPRFDAFQKGFRARVPKLPLTGQGEPFDAVLVLADEDPLDRLKSARAEIDLRLKGLARVNWECGRYLDDDGTVREPFGFADGISQPAFFDFEDNPNALHWKPFAKLALLLTRDPSSTVQDDEYGSLMAFMKIEQNVTGFQGQMKQMAKSFGQAAHYPQSWMVGRDANGKPLMPTGAGNNDFVYDTDPKFQVCPAAAHIRKANPRTPETIGARIVRRGVPYDFEGTKGLLFQSFGSTLEETFEAILNTWLLNEDFPPNASSPGMDPFLGTRNAAPAPAGFPMAAHPKIPSMSTVKAGEYFYFPSIPAFGRLDE